MLRGNGVIFFLMPFLSPIFFSIWKGKKNALSIHIPYVKKKFYFTISKVTLLFIPYYFTIHLTFQTLFFSPVYLNILFYYFFTISLSLSLFLSLPQPLAPATTDKEKKQRHHH